MGVFIPTDQAGEPKPMRIPHRSWIFDMDGTLTVAAHDFDAFKRSQDLDLSRPILEQLEGLGAIRRQRVQQALVAWEAEIADQARSAPDVLPLLMSLHEQGHRLGILTRNTRELALRTLDAAGLATFFPEETVLGRHCAPPKPSPHGLHQILDQWKVQPAEAVMVGDFVFDLQAGRSAGMFTIYIDRDGTRMWQDHADLRLERLDLLLDET